MALFSMVLLSLTLSCSKGLWEQRSECPSAFVMDFSGVSEDVESLDSSQETAVYMAKKCNGLVIYGPPGTGK